MKKDYFNIKQIIEKFNTYYFIISGRGNGKQYAEKLKEVNKMKDRFVYKKEETICPQKFHIFDAGYDIFLPEDIILKPFETKAIDLKVGVNLAENECGIICMRSSIAKKGLIAHTSPIDYGYKDNIHLIVTNCSGINMSFKMGDRICQLVIFNIPIEHNSEYFKNEERK